MIKCQNLAELYSKFGKALLSEGSTVSPRGFETKELLCQTVLIEDPRSRLIYNKDRNFSLVYAVVESIMLFSSVNITAPYTYFNKRMYTFSDDGVTFYGCYGARIADKIIDVVTKLVNDSSSRQAVLTIYNSNDIAANSKDIPCTVMMQFFIRDNKLHLNVHMRSNDIIYGTPYDIYNFTNLQEAIANTLGIDVGYYYHTVGSWHCYKEMFGKNTYELLESLINYSEPIDTKIKFNANNYQTVARDYVNLIIDPKHVSNLANVECLSLGTAALIHGSPYAIILNEMQWMKGEERHFTPPKWAEKFTKRWYK